MGAVTQEERLPVTKPAPNPSQKSSNSNTPQAKSRHIPIVAIAARVIALDTANPLSGTTIE
jgi:hypothetical protein